MVSLPDAESQIRIVIESLRMEKQRQRELKRNQLHEALIVALHTNSHWTKAKWR